MNKGLFLIKNVMKKLVLLSISLIGCLNFLLAQCFVNPNNVVAFNTGTKAYGVVKEAKTWSAARACAVQFNGRLTIIESQAEQDSVFAILGRSSITNSNTVAPDGGGASYVWLGGNDKTTEGNWIWDNYVSGSGQFWMGARTGSIVGGLYNNWGNEPDNFQNQDALGFALSSWPFGIAGEWNDVDESNALYFIVEYPNTTSVEEIFKMNSIQLQPNPTTNNLTINCTTCKSKSQNIRIYSASGQLILDKVINIRNVIDVSGYSEGTYIVQLIDENITMTFQKQ